MPSPLPRPWLRSCSASVPKPAGCGSFLGTCPETFPCLRQQSGYDKRLRAAVPLLKRVIRLPVTDIDLWTDACWGG